MDEKELIEEIRKGSQESFRQIYDLYQHKVYNTAFGFVHITEDAQDITQEVFVELYHSLHKFRGESSLGTWIYRVTVNKSLNHLRKKKNKSIFFRPARQSENDQPIMISEPADQQQNPSDALENRELQRQLQQAIDGLPEKQRVAFILDKFEDLPYKEIARVMETSLSSVESLLFRAKLNLQKKLLGSWKERQ